MSTRRERAKEPAARLNRQLAEMDVTKKIHLENQKKNLRYADIFTNLANLVFGGIIIGGVFENMKHPFYLYSIGFSVFFILIWLGNVYYNKGIKEF
ncbi:MAG: hypothetical protein IJV25_08165 [Prevotella sp.]|nr:hypothetical protein [Prevotella sp.]